MRALIVIFLLTEIFSSIATADILPGWVTSSPTQDSQYNYIICSAEGLDAEAVKQEAEAQCLISAAKVSGVLVIVKSKTIQSLGGSDTSEIAEIEPIRKSVNCEMTKRFLEKTELGFRVWLQCRVSKKSISPRSSASNSFETSFSNQENSYKKAVATITMLPKADVLIIGGKAVERAVAVKRNVESIEIDSSDEFIVAKKRGYKDQKLPIQRWDHGAALNFHFVFERGI